MLTWLSSSGVRVSRLALGTATFGVAPQEDAAVELVHAALDAGINFIDTANSYGNQARFDRDGVPDWTQRRSAEEIVGSALQGRREEVVLATKVSERVGDGPNDGGFEGGGLSRAHIMRNVERSLGRLQTDYIDIYHAHHPDPATDIEDTVRTFADLVAQGVIRYYALSTFDGWQVMEVMATAERLGLPKPVCHQTRYSLAKRWVEAEVLPASRRAGLDVTAFSPLAGGLLAVAGDARAYSGDARWGGPSFSAGELALRDRFAACAADWGIPAAQLALAWLLAQKGVVGVVVGPESAEELTELLPAVDVSLSSDQMAALDGISPGPPNLWTQ